MTGIIGIPIVGIPTPIPPYIGIPTPIPIPICILGGLSGTGLLLTFLITVCCNARPHNFGTFVSCALSKSCRARRTRKASLPELLSMSGGWTSSPRDCRREGSGRG